MPSSDGAKIKSDSVRPLCAPRSRRDILLAAGTKLTSKSLRRMSCFWGSQKDGTVRSTMLKRETFTIETIYVPVKRRRTLDPKRVEEIAQSMLVDGQTTPILVRPDGARFVLVEGLHRLEAAKALGEQTIVGFRVAAPKH